MRIARKTLIFTVLLTVLLRRTGSWRGAGDMYGRLCDGCGTSWPHDRAYESCPRCRTVTRVSTIRKALTAEQAKLEVRRIEFERFYDSRELERQGPSPEQRGREEARLIIELDRQLGEG